MTDEPEVRIRFGEGNPHCLHCQIGDVISTLLTYHRSNGYQVSFLMVLGSLVHRQRSP